MNIFRTRKALKAEIADLVEQIIIQSQRMNILEKTNLNLNKENFDLHEKNEAQAATIAELHQQIIDARQKNDDLANEVAQLQDANCGLASSVSDLKKKLTALQKTAKAAKPKDTKPTAKPKE